MAIKVLFFVVTFLSALPAAAEEQEKETVVVMDLRAAGIDKDAAFMVSERLRSSIAGTGLYTLVSREEMENILKEQTFQKSDMCDSTKCYAEIGGALGAKKMVAGSVGLLGKTYTITIKLIDIGQVKEEKSVSEDCKCEIDELLGMVTRAACRLVGAAEPPVAPRPVEQAAVQPALPPAPLPPLPPPAAVKQPEPVSPPPLPAEQPPQKRFFASPLYGVSIGGENSFHEFKLALGLREFMVLWLNLGFSMGLSQKAKLGDGAATAEYDVKYTVNSLGQEVRVPIIESNDPPFGVDGASIAVRAGFHLAYCKATITTTRNIADRLAKDTNKMGYAAGAGIDVYWFTLDMLYRKVSDDNGVFTGARPAFGIKFFF